ncbi:MAG TPA: nucleotidyltransferase family protein [Ktedonobacterales bacterium]
MPAQGSLGTHPAPRLPLTRVVAILRQHGVVRAALFGSFARGEQHEHSDVDLLVEFAPGHSLLALADLERALTDLLGRSVEIVTYKSLDPRIRASVLRDQVVIL